MNYELFKKFTIDVFVAVHPMVAQATKSDEVINIKAQGRIARPRLDVMGAQAACTSVGRTATGAMVIIPLVNRAQRFLPGTRRIQPLAFWRTAILEVGIAIASSARHRVGLACLPPMFSLADGCHVAAGYRELSQVLVDVGIGDATFLCYITGGSLKFNILTLQPLSDLVRPTRISDCPSALARWYAIVREPLIDTLRVTINKFRNAVCTQLFDKIFLSKPCLVNGLLSFLPLTFACEGTEAARPLTATNDFSTAVLTV